LSLDEFSEVEVRQNHAFYSLQARLVSAHLYIADSEVVVLMYAVMIPI